MREGKNLEDIYVGNQAANDPKKSNLLDLVANKSEIRKS